jgi:pyruvate/2-oxoglutarate dehydrogenase complex dihydrolipoamide dehydrogenase (E3) component
MPSKALLHAAAGHACGDAWPWSRAAEFRDYMIDREAGYPDDTGHERRLRDAGAETLRGTAHIVGQGRVHVALRDGGQRSLQARDVVVATGSRTKVPPMDGLDRIEPWSNREATSASELPRSLLILGGGPTGVELAQVFARFGVPVTLVESNERILARDHPRNSAAVREGLERDGVTIRTGTRAERVVAGGGADGAHRVELRESGTVDGHEIVLAIGRDYDLGDVGLENVGVDVAKLKSDGGLRLGDGLWLIGDPAGPEMHTHMSHYQGELVARMALGDDVRPDYSAIPRCTYTDPEAAFVGLSLEDAQAAGHDAIELVEDLGKSAKGYVTEAAGHVTVVVDRRERRLLGAAISGPGATEAIHEAVLAVKARIPITVLADTIHAFPTTARVLGTTFAQAARALGSDGSGA